MKDNLDLLVNLKILSVHAKCRKCGVEFESKCVFYGDGGIGSLYEDFCSDECIDAYNVANRTNIKKS
jgi:hypothetical protein